MGTFNTSLYPAQSGLNLGKTDQEWNGAFGAISAKSISGAFLTGFVTVDFNANPLFTPTNLNLNVFQFTLTGDVASSIVDVSASAAGAIFIFQIIQDSAGHHSFAWPVNTSNGQRIGSDAEPNTVVSQMFILDTNGNLQATPGDPFTSISRSNDSGSVGFVKINTGLQIESSLQISNGSIITTQNSAFLALKNSGFFGFIQAGDPSSGDPVWFAENTFTLPRLSAGSSVAASGFILAITGAVAGSASGNGLFLDSELGKMLDSGIGMNTHISFPVNTRRVEWLNGSNAGILTSAAVTSTQTWTLPDTTGTVVILVNPPANSTAPGTSGSMAFDGSFAYFCVATNTWVRTAVASW